MQRAGSSSMFDPAILVPAIGPAFVKLDPRLLIKNPVMFVVEIVAALTTMILVREMVTGDAHLGFTFQIVDLAVADCRVRQLRRGRGRRARQGAGGDAAAGAHRDDGEAPARRRRTTTRSRRRN